MPNAPLSPQASSIQHEAVKVAIQGRDAPRVRALIAAGASVREAWIEPASCSPLGTTSDTGSPTAPLRCALLAWAIRVAPYLATVDALLDAGAPIHLDMDAGMNAWHAALKWGNHTIVDRVLAATHIPAGAPFDGHGGGGTHPWVLAFKHRGRDLLLQWLAVPAGQCQVDISVELALVQVAVRRSDLEFLTALKAHVPNVHSFVEYVAECAAVRAIQQRPQHRGAQRDTWSVLTWALDHGAQFSNAHSLFPGNGKALDALVALPWAPQGPLARWLSKSGPDDLGKLATLCQTAVNIGRLQGFKRTWSTLNAFRPAGALLSWEKANSFPLSHLAITTVLNLAPNASLPPPWGCSFLTLKALLKAVWGADAPGRCDAHGNTALHHLMIQVARVRPLWGNKNRSASERFVGWMALALVARGLTPCQPNHAGKTALDLADEAFPKLAELWRAHQIKDQLVLTVPEGATRARPMRL